jgi:hypothetical protein
MRQLKRAIGINFFIASALVWLAILYAKKAGIPIDDLCMGFHHAGRMFDPPVWIAPAAVQGIVAALFIAAQNFSLEKRCREFRIFIGVMSAVAILYWIVPKILPLETAWTRGEQSYGILIWRYACISDFLLALGGPWKDED